MVPAPLAANLQRWFCEGHIHVCYPWCTVGPWWHQGLIATDLQRRCLCNLTALIPMIKINKTTFHKEFQSAATCWKMIINLHYQAALRYCLANEGLNNQVLSWIHTRSQAFFLSLCRMRIFVFLGQERLTDRSISKRYLKSDIATWVEKSSTSRAIHARDTGFYWSSENVLHECFIASSGVGVWMKTLQLIAKW